MADIKRTSYSRRSFFLQGSAALGAGLASAAAAATAPVFDRNMSLEEKTGKLEIMEDANVIRELHLAYSNHLNNRAYEDLINLFADDGEVCINGIIYKGKDKGLRKLFVGQSGQGENPAGINHNRLYPDQSQLRDTIEVAADRQTAKARFHCVVQANEQFVGESSIFEMARLQGMASRQWQETGVHEVTFVKSGDNWRIKQLSYKTVGQDEIA